MRLPTASVAFAFLSSVRVLPSLKVRERLLVGQVAGHLLKHGPPTFLLFPRGEEAVQESVPLV